MLDALTDLAALAARACGVPAVLIRTPDSVFEAMAAFGDVHAADLANRLVIPVTNDPESFGLDTETCELVLLDRSPIALSPEKACLAEGLARQAGALLELGGNPGGSGGESGPETSLVDEQFRDILELVPDAMLVHAQGRILYVNSAMVRLAGAKDASALIGMPVTSLFAPESREAAEGLVEDAYEKGLPTTRRTYKFRRYDGKEIPLELASMALRLESGDCRLVAVRDLTSRVEAAETLRESETRFQAFMDQSPVTAWTKDGDGRFIYANRSMREFLGAPAHGDINAYFDGFPERFRKEMIESDQQVLEGKPVQSIERFPGPDGAMRSWWVNKFPFTGKHGQRLIGGIGLETTEREKAEARTRVFADIFRNIQVGVFVWKLEGPIESASFRLLATNSAAARMTKLSIEDLIGKTMQEAFPGVHRSGLAQSCAQVIATGQSLELGDAPCGGPGSLYTSKVIPLPNDTVAVVFENVTEERKNREVLRQSVERFELIARATNDAVWEWKPAGGETWWNERLYQLFGYPPGTLPGMEAWEARLHPEDRERALASLRQVLEDGAHTWVREYRISRLDGSVAHIYERGYALRDEDGKPMRMLGAMLDISDLKRAEAAVRESENRYRLLFLNNPQSMWLFDPGTLRFLDVNDAALARYGYTRGEFLALSLRDIWVEEDRPKLEPVIEELRRKRSLSGVRRHRLRNGTVVHAEVFYHFIRFPDQDAVIALSNDITDKLEALERLRHSEERYRTLAAISPVGLYRVDLKGRWIFVNEHMCRLLGRKPGELVGSEAPPIMHSDDADWVKEAWYAAQAEKRPFHAEYRVLAKDGRIIWVMGNALADKAPDGTPIGFVGTITDITERKQAEILLACQKRTLALIASGLPLQDVLESLVQSVERESAGGMGAVLLLDDPAGSLAWTASAALPEGFRSRCGPIPLGEAGGPLGLAAERKESIVSADLPPDGTGHQGPAREFGLRACSARPILGSHGELLGVFAFFYGQAGEPPAYDTQLMETASDLAVIAVERHGQEEIARKNQDLQEQNLRILEASRMKSEFLANMSHELRTPLNAIIGFSQLLIDRKVGPMNDKQTEYMGDILDGGMHLLRLINDVLDLAKIEAGKMQLYREEISVAQAMREVCDILLPMALGKNVTVRHQAGPGADEAFLDGRKVRQVLYNLVSNAIKFSKQGGRVEVRSRADGHGGLTLEVADQGIGIHQDDLGKLFQQFQQLDSGSARHYPGTGLGLVITKKLVELHEGTVAVESKPNVGSVFSAHFPLVPGEE
ncbi:MAG: PAS domain S-box protein [Fibrobacteres bacterium]|nr:PAS domain S-box protein [Fibrobacterota bacterium]